MRISHHSGSKQFDGKLRGQRLAHAIGPDIARIKTLLYIGARPNRIDHIDLFKEHDITILEIWEPNVTKLRRSLKAGKPHKNLVGAKKVKIIQGDVRSFKLDQKFDMAMWWHGPEHVPLDDVGSAVRNLEAHAKKLVVLGCPWGSYPLEFPNNPFEKHVAAIQPKLFADLGYDVEVQGVEGAGSNIMAIKRL